MKIGTRGSQLALWQAREVSRLIADTGGPVCELVIMRTSGDESAGPPDAPSSAVGRRMSGVDGPTADTRPPTTGPSVKRLFVKEIEDALLEGRIDLAVHSSKDLAATLPDGLAIGAALAREDPRDAIVLPHGRMVETLEALHEHVGKQPRFGTSSVRRAAHLAAIFPRATFVPIRGNVDTRLRKLDAGACDALVLASAGLKRLGLAARISLALPVDLSIPAPGQGIVAIEVREDRSDAADAIIAISNRDAMDALAAERAVVQTLGGGCQMPLGAHAQIEGRRLALNAIVSALDGRRAIRERGRDARDRAEALGGRLGRRLLEKGARELLGA